MLIKQLNRGIKLSFVIATLAIASVVNTTVHAQQTQLFGDVTIKPNFSPNPMTVRGMSGGSVPGNQVVKTKETPTGPCTGFVDAEPDHSLRLTSKFNFLKLLVKSPQDTTIIVSGPGGVWCNDDFEGKNPGIAGEWLAGTYKVWVGSYEKDKYFPYTLTITTGK